MQPDFFDVFYTQGYLHVSEGEKLQYKNFSSTQNINLINVSQAVISEKKFAPNNILENSNKKHVVQTYLDNILNYAIDSDRDMVIPSFVTGLETSQLRDLTRFMCRYSPSMSWKRSRAAKQIRAHRFLKDFYDVIMTIPKKTLEDNFSEEYDADEWKNDHISHEGNRFVKFSFHRIDVFAFPDSDDSSKLIFSKLSNRLIQIAELKLVLPILEMDSTEVTGGFHLYVRCSFNFLIYLVSYHDNSLCLKSINNFGQCEHSHFAKFSHIFNNEYLLCTEKDLKLYDISKSIVIADHAPNTKSDFSLSTWKRGVITDHPRQVIQIENKCLSLIDFRKPKSLILIPHFLENNPSFSPVVDSLSPNLPYIYCFGTSTHLNLIDLRNSDNVLQSFFHNLNYEPSYFCHTPLQYNDINILGYLSSYKNNDGCFCFFETTSANAFLSIQGNIKAQLPLVRDKIPGNLHGFYLQVAAHNNVTLFTLGSDGTVIHAEYQISESFSKTVNVLEQMDSRRYFEKTCNYPALTNLFYRNKSLYADVKNAMASPNTIKDPPRGYKTKSNITDQKWIQQFSTKTMKPKIARIYSEWIESTEEIEQTNIIYDIQKEKDDSDENSIDLLDISLDDNVKF